MNNEKKQTNHNFKKGKDKNDTELSEEDNHLKANLEILVERLKESDVNLHEPSLESLTVFIRTSTSSMTAVPKPLKFLRPYFSELTEIYKTWPESNQKTILADILSVLGMTYAKEGKRESLKYCLLGKKTNLDLWGHEYMRHLSAEIGEEYSIRIENDASTNDLMELALRIVPFFLSHNAEADAVDLLLELEAIEKLPPFIDSNTYSRVCSYIVSCVNLLAPPDDVAFLKTAHTIYRNQGKLAQALTLAIRLGDYELIKSDFNSTNDLSLKKQMAYLIARQQIWFEDDNENINECLRNSRLSELFKFVAKELNVLEPKTPDDIYKSHLETRSMSLTSVDSAKQNLANTFVNAFVNVGFGNDKLILSDDNNTSWIYKNKDTGMMSAVASIGMIMLWDIEMGLAQIDKYLYSSDENIKAGALLGIGLINTGVHDESDPALALLGEYLENKDTKFKISAIVGLGMAYAGSNMEDIVELLLPFLNDTELPMEISSLAALSLGMVFVGSCNGDITSAILQTMMERESKYLEEKWGCFMSLGLALLYAGKQDASDATLEILKAINHPIARQADVLVDIFSYAGTGNVLKIQGLLHICSSHLDNDKEKNDLHQGFAVLGLALIAMGEDIGGEMILRHFDHLKMYYGEPVIRKAVPLALGLLSASNPQIRIFETLSRYSHDTDIDVAINAIFAMGLVGSGTNNARLAQLFRQLASYYHKTPNALFMVRVAQGLLHMGKGTMTLSPYHTDRQIMSYVSISGLFTVLVSMMNSKFFILDTFHWILYYLTMAIHPRMLLTVDEFGNFQKTTVRQGTAVDIVGQIGRPKTITGFQTLETPTLLQHSDRAELATDKYIPLTPTLEWIVILRKNPNYMEEDT
ncbi:proteasome regulatory particle base subunit RPN1 [Pneumocystis jirovecii RU7]|uniref:26S proteasome regulatory subunit RPN1 n=1 Tax=Pneumocystis jirovecii (strain RU7) TaxID=1408657 RepID=A0A0W4ZVW0_PNEJ7|nr:proteasome regulatory particle base subunit RPN1 [Pneumocystis jirovecii RU7]KTW32511.1 hypothetical protein T551_00601 [Pneumocystis jirovecii RU7]